MQRSSQLEAHDLPEGIASVIYDKWHRLNTDRQTWLDRGLEARSYVTAADTNATEVGSLPWKNKTTIPKLTQIADGLQAYYMAAILPNDEWFVWEGRDADSHRKAKLIEEYMRTKVRMSGFRLELEKIIRDWILYGTCYGGVAWVKETTTSAVTGEEITNYVGPRLYRISPIDCAIDPRASSFDHSPFFERALVSIGDVLAHNDTVSAPKYDEEMVEKLKTIRGTGARKENFIDFYKERGLEIDGFQTIDNYVESGLVELITYWGDVFDPTTGEMHRNRVITIADGWWVLRNEENPAWNGKKPVAMANWRIRPDNLYGQSPIENLVGMQYRVDHLENAKADAFDQTIHPMVIIKGDVTEDFEWMPGGKFHVPAEGAVDVLRPDASVLVADNEIAVYHAYMEQMAGVPREMMGFRSPGEKTAFEVSVLQQGADRQFIDKVNHFEETFIQPILDLMFELTIRNLDVEDVARTFNDDTGALELTALTKEDVVADGVLRPIGSKYFEKRAKRIQELSNLLTMADNPKIGLHINGEKAAQMLGEELGWDKYGVIEPFGAIREGAMAQFKTQQAQQQLAEAGVEPTGGAVSDEQESF